MLEALLAGKAPVASGGGPGPSALTTGNNSNGLYGSLAAADFMSGSELAALTGANAYGTLINDTVDWLKLSKDGNVIYMPKKAIRTGLTWNMINTLGMRTPAQNKIVTKGGFKYRVRLMTGTGPAWANQTGDDPAGCSESDYNRFIYRLTTAAAASKTPPVLGTYSLSDLGLMLADNGSCVICQEGSTSSYVQRNGGSQETYNGTSWNSLQNGVSSNLADQYRGWRPILELVP